MNNRIKELAQQAGFDFGRDWQVIGQSEDSLKVFAESIVLECAHIAEDIQQFYDDHNDSVVNTEIWTMIKHHFGLDKCNTF